MRSLLRHVIGGSLAIALATALVRIAASTSGEHPSRDPADYAILANGLLRTKGGPLRVSGGAIGVVNGSLSCPGGIEAPGQDVVAQVAKLGRQSTCRRLYAGVAAPPAVGCPASPLGAFTDPIVPDLGAACGFPASFPSGCTGDAITVGHTGLLELGSGPFGPVRVLGGGAVRSGALRFQGGRYDLCSLRLARGAGLLFDGAADVFISGDLEVFNDAFVGPAAPADLSPANVRFFVNGGRVRISRQARFNATVCAPHSALGLGRGARVNGRLFANTISAEGNASVTLVAPPTGPTTTSTTGHVTTTSTSRPPATTTSTSRPPTTTTSLPATTTSTSLPPVTTTSTSLQVTTTSTSLPPTTTSTSLPVTTTTTSLPPATTSTSPPATTTSTSLPPTTTTTTGGNTTTTTTLPLGKLRVTFKQGTTSCGGAGLYQHCFTGNKLGGTNGLGACTVDADCGNVGTPNGSDAGTAARAPMGGEVLDG